MAQRETRDALFSAIEKTTEETVRAQLHPQVRAIALRDLALAYRYLAGGAQPGSSVVEK